jgi:hypothetical protein
MGRWLNAARSVAVAVEKTHIPSDDVLTKPTKPPSVSFVSSDFEHIENFRADGSTFDERAGMATDSVPAVYLDAWARFQCQPSKIASANAWWQAVADAGILLDLWGATLASFDWPAEAIFGADGLVWAIDGEPVRAIGPDHAIMASGRVFDRSSFTAGGDQ